MDIISKYFPELKPKVEKALSMGATYEDVAKYVLDNNPKFKPFRKRLDIVYQNTGDLEAVFRTAKELYLNHLKLNDQAREVEKYKEKALSLTQNIKDMFSNIFGGIADTAASAGEKYAELEQKYPTTTQVINATAKAGAYVGTKAMNLFSLPHTIPAFITHTLKGKYSLSDWLDAVKGIVTLSRDESFGEDLGVTGVILDMGLDWLTPGILFKHITKAGKLVNALKKAGKEAEFLQKGIEVFDKESDIYKTLSKSPKIVTEMKNIIQGKQEAYARGLLNLKGEVVKRLPENWDITITELNNKLNTFLRETYTATINNLKLDKVKPVVNELIDSLGAKTDTAAIKGIYKSSMEILDDISNKFVKKLKQYNIDDPTNPFHDITTDGARWFLKQLDEIAELSKDFDKFEKQIYNKVSDVTDSLNNTYHILKRKWERALVTFAEKNGLLNLDSEEFKKISYIVEALGQEYAFEGAKKWKEVKTFINKYKDVTRATLETDDLVRNTIYQIRDLMDTAEDNLFKSTSAEKTINKLIKKSYGDIPLFQKRKSFLVGGKRTSYLATDIGKNGTLQVAKDLEKIKKYQLNTKTIEKLVKQGELPEELLTKEKLTLGDLYGKDIDEAISKLNDYYLTYVKTDGVEDKVAWINRQAEKIATWGELPEINKLKPKDRQLVRQWVGEETYKKAQTIQKMLAKLYEVRSVVTGEVGQIGYLRRAITDEFKAALKSNDLLKKSLDLAVTTQSPFEHNLFTSVSRSLKFEIVEIPEPYQEIIGKMLGLEKATRIPLFPVVSLAKKNPNFLTKKGILQFLKKVSQETKGGIKSFQKRQLSMYEINELAQQGELFPVVKNFDVTSTEMEKLGEFIESGFTGKVYQEDVVKGLWDVFMDMPKFQVIEKESQLLKQIGRETKTKNWLTPKQYFEKQGWLARNSKVRRATLKILTSPEMLGNKYYPKKVLDHFFKKFTAVSFDLASLIETDKSTMGRFVDGFTYLMTLPMKFIRQKMGSSFAYHGANILDGVLKNLRQGIVEKDTYRKATELYTAWLGKMPKVFGSEYHTELAKYIGNIRKPKKIVFKDVFGRKLYGNQLINEAVNYGVIGVGRANTETINDIAKLIVGARSEGKASNELIGKLTKVLKEVYGWEGSFIGDNMRAIGQLGEEMMARLPMYIHYRMLGYAAKDAAQAVWQTHFAWDRLTSYEAKVLRNFIPFYNFIKNNTIYWAKMATQHPEALGVLKDMSELVGYMSYAVQDKSYNQYLLDKTKAPFYLKNVPPFFNEKLRLYTNRIDSATDFLNIVSAILNLYQLKIAQEKGETTVTSELYQKIHPSIQFIMNLLTTGKLPYSHQKITLISFFEKYFSPRVSQFVKQLIEKPYQALGGIVIKQQKER